jgi:EAL domain-containing protein (putative c-di-GMP-specific phosphodiesterase class I)
MNARALEQLTLESAMRRALANDEFVLHYQPIVDVASGAVLGTEALLRWQHPELGLLAPDDFIFLAEVTGLVVPVGELALRTACAQTRAWQLAGRPGLRASVNLSVRQLQQHDFVDRVARALEDSGLPAGCLELEVTESIAMHSAEHSADGSIEKLRALKRLGVRIAIDDFGTGYSSLSVLRLLPVDALKIDRSFVRDVGASGAPAGDSTAIATAVIALAHSLNLAVVAEGVETPEQLRFLAGQRCDSWQGFLAARPAPADVCTRLLMSSSPADAWAPTSGMHAADQT